jgi:hypothetical protein
LRLVAEQPEADAGEDRAHRNEIERAADQGGGQKAVLPDQRIVEHHRKADGEQQAEMAADDRAHHCKIGQEARRDPADEGGRVGKLRQ